MTIAPLTPQAAADLPCPGITESLDRTDAWQTRHGGTWLTTREDGDVLARRADGTERAVRFPDPTGDHRGYTTPAPGGTAFAVCGNSAVTLLDSNGTARWNHPHDPWSADHGSGRGTCAFTPDGRHLIAVVPGPLATGGYEGDVLVVLDRAAGTPAATATYEIRQSLEDSGQLVVSAGRGQDGALTYIAVFDGTDLHTTELDTKDGPVTDIDTAGQHLLTLERGGANLTLRTLGEDQRFVGRPVLLGDSLIPAAVADEEWAEETRHFPIDAATLQPLAEITYPHPAGPDITPLPDSSRLTPDDDRLNHWHLHQPPPPEPPTRHRHPSGHHATPPTLQARVINQSHTSNTQIKMTC
ncbi:hypothetical protein OU787_03780 [Kitasatospora sp. YST-16]|uniref:hypothetical protein n=1 Tax=Kitasatospora sp. YST-16 TaxID=2998080 RepID=UPI002283D7AF|nr:hypothetical protein [Kitasatospora sp. YST-16]WAL70691.1 hypothetical protein OU787_03780 [Kitasatospora sp. YST-16]WNW36734.1 hypothetical protein RKE32_03770 [Streptomyces sp. Li-HN-5-13]